MTDELQLLLINCWGDTGGHLGKWVLSESGVHHGTSHLGVTEGTAQRLSSCVTETISFAQGMPPAEGLSKKKKNENKQTNKNFKMIAFWNGLLYKNKANLKRTVNHAMNSTLQFAFFKFLSMDLE